jgi:hypothetical protein
MWDGDEWRIVGDKFDTEAGRLRLAATETEWVEEIREGEDVGPTAVVPLDEDKGSYSAPFYSTAGTAYPQYTGWVPESTVAAYRTEVGVSPYLGQADAAANYVAFSQAAPAGVGALWLGAYWEPWTPTGTVISAYVEFQFQAHGDGSSGPDPRLFWGVSGNQYYFTNSQTGSESGTAFGRAEHVGWATHRMSLIDERFSTQTKAKLLTDLANGDLMAAVHMNMPFDVSAIRLVVQYADEETRPLKMWMHDAVGTFAGWVEVARMRPMP